MNITIQLFLPIANLCKQYVHLSRFVQYNLISFCCFCKLMIYINEYHFIVLVYLLTFGIPNFTFLKLGLRLWVCFKIYSWTCQYDFQICSDVYLFTRLSMNRAIQHSHSSWQCWWGLFWQHQLSSCSWLYAGVAETWSLHM